MRKSNEHSMSDLRSSQNHDLNTTKHKTIRHNKSPKILEGITGHSIGQSKPTEKVFKNKVLAQTSDIIENVFLYLDILFRLIQSSIRKEN